jgi:hypothetical protein
MKCTHETSLGTPGEAAVDPGTVPRASKKRFSRFDSPKRLQLRFKLIAGIFLAFHSLVEVMITECAFHQLGLGPSLESLERTFCFVMVLKFKVV